MKKIKYTEKNVVAKPESLLRCFRFLPPSFFSSSSIYPLFSSSLFLSSLASLYLPYCSSHQQHGFLHLPAWPPTSFAVYEAVLLLEKGSPHPTKKRKTPLSGGGSQNMQGGVYNMHSTFQEKKNYFLKFFLFFSMKMKVKALIL